MNETLTVIVRALIAFFTLLIFARLIGKEQITQLTFFDYVFGITIGSIAASLTTDLSLRAWPHFVGLVTWTAAVLGLQFVTMKFRRVDKLVQGEPTVVVMNGQIMEDALRKMRFRLVDLIELLRTKGVFNIGQVEFAVLEASGSISVQMKSEYRPVTPHDLKTPTEYEGMPTEVVYDGQVVEQNLRHLGLDRAWLEEKLATLGVKDVQEVFYAALDTQGRLYVDTYKDNVQHVTDPSDYRGVH